jgi:hypothetical protein
MKLTFIYTLLFASLVMLSSANAQNDVAFKVLASKGNATMTIGDDTKPLKAGVAVPSNATIDVSASSMLGLMYKNGRTLELRESGKYPVTELVKQAIAKTNSTVQSQYTKYVIAQVTQNGDQQVGSAPGRNMAVTGAVLRSTPGAKPTKITLLLPPTEVLPESSPRIHWTENQLVPGKKYLVEVFDNENTLLMKKEVTDTTSALVLSSIPNIKSQNLIFVKVVSEDKLQQSVSVPVYLSKADADIKAEYKDLVDHIDSKSATDYIGAAFYCESLNLNADAYHFYQEALKLSPDVQEYKDAFANFIAKTKMKTAPKK